MRFILPSYSLPDNFTENVAVTLRAMGHEVLTAPVPSQVMDQRLMHLMQVGLEKFAPNWIPPQEKWMLKHYRKFRPDVMIALTHAVSEDTLLQLQRDGVRTVAWWGDTPANMRKQGLLTKGWDIVYLKDRFAVSKLRILGMNAQFMAEAMNPLWHRKNHERVGADVVIAGNAYEYRHFLIRRMLDVGITPIRLYGNKPARWAHPDVNALFVGRYIVKEEKSKVFGEALACINSTSMTEGNSINCRTFEIAGAEGLQMMEYRPAIEDCFDPGKEILIFRSLDELKDLLDFHAAHPQAARSVREAAGRRALAEHTYRHRLETIMADIGK